MNNKAGYPEPQSGQGLRHVREFLKLELELTREEANVLKVWLEEHENSITNTPDFGPMECWLMQTLQSKLAEMVEAGN